MLKQRPTKKNTKVGYLGFRRLEVMTIKVALVGEMGFIRKRKRWREGVVGREMSICKDSSLTGSSGSGEW